MRLSMYGMTLIELVLVVALIGIGILAAAPSFNSIVSKNQTTTQINELVIAINLARSEASKVSGVVSLQATNTIDNTIDNIIDNNNERRYHSFVPSTARRRCHQLRERFTAIQRLWRHA